MRDTELNLFRLLSVYSRTSSKLWFSRLSVFVETFQVTKRLAHFSVRIFTAKRTAASRFSTTRSLTCKGLPSEIRKIVVVMCSLCWESGGRIHRMSALKCALLSSIRYSVFSIGFIHVFVMKKSFKWCRIFSQLWMKGVFQEVFDESKVTGFYRTKKIFFSQVSSFSLSIL